MPEHEFHPPSVNALASRLLNRLRSDPDYYRVQCYKEANGVEVVDAGIKQPGGLETGRLIAEICMGGLGQVSFTYQDAIKEWSLAVNVHTCNPVLACLGSQYAGWTLSAGEGKNRFYAPASGPARALACKEAIYKKLAYQDHADRGILVLETDRFPPVELMEKIAQDCHIQPDHLTLILAPTTSLVGSIQVTARVLEVALHKANELDFPLENIIDGTGTAPVAPPAPDFVEAMGRTNDSILFGGQINLFVVGDKDEAKQLAENLPSTASKDYGIPFAQVFKNYDQDFYKIDRMLFSPAKVTVTHLPSGESYRHGKLAPEILELSFGK